MIIRKLIEKDLPQVLNLCREVRQHHRDILNGYFTEQDDAIEQIGFVYSLTKDNMVALVAEDDGNLCGYLLAEIKNAPYLQKSKIAHICNFGVAKKMRRHGIGRALMDAFYELCREENVDEIRLDVFNKNVEASRFYERYGFLPLEQRMNLQVHKK